MTTKNTLSNIAALALLLTSFAWQAAADTPVYVRVGVDASDFGYKEYGPDGTELDREEGYLPGLALSARTYWQAYFAELSLDYSRAEVDYRASTASLDIRSDTREEMMQWQLLAGREWTLGPKGVMDLTLGLGMRDWERDIQSTASADGLLEEYHWNFASIGAHYSHQFDARHRATIGYEYRSLFSADLDVKFRSGDFDDTNLSLPDGDGRAIVLQWRYDWRPTVSWVLSGHYRFWDIPRSKAWALSRNGVLLGSTVTEPRSETREVALRLSLERKW